MSDSFIFEWPIKTLPQIIKTLLVRFEAGRHLYNACLKECLRRVDHVKESQDWQKARKLPRSKERSRLFREALKKQQFSEYALHTFSKDIAKSCFIGDHLDSQVIQKIATRAWSSADEYCKGKRGRPRYKSRGQFSSLEGKSNVTGIRFKNGKIIWNSLELELLYDPIDKDGVEAHALSCRTKYVRLVRRKKKDQELFFAQLVQEGKPLIKKKHVIGKGKVVGLDLGPSTIAIVSHEKAKLDVFCSQLDRNQKKIKSLQNGLGRSRKAMNPDNYTEKGVPIKNSVWKFSKRYHQIRELLAREYQIMAATRKSLHGRLSNEILSYGTVIKAEKLSYRGWQRQFGRSVSFRAPGKVIEILRRKAENAGGRFHEFSPYKTKLSQLCHACNTTRKKALKDRFHVCNCGLGSIQRDLYSAYLAMYVNDDDCFDRSQASEAWASADPLLRQALSKYKEMAKGNQRVACFGIFQRQSCLSVEARSTYSEVKNVVRGENIPLESFEELSCFASRTPRL